MPTMPQLFSEDRVSSCEEEAPGMGRPIYNPLYRSSATTNHQDTLQCSFFTTMAELTRQWIQRADLGNFTRFRKGGKIGELVAGLTDAQEGRQFEG